MALALMAGLLFALNPSVTQAGFVAPTAITIDGTFTDWTGNVYSQTDGYTPSGTSGDKDITTVWSAMSTATGNSPASSGNLIQNVYFRVDTAETSSKSTENYWFQVNLGAAPAGYADHVVQFYVDTSAAGTTADPKVKIVLYLYSTYPLVGALTTGGITAKVANYAVSGAVNDPNAIGVWGVNSATSTYGFEAKIPIGWYSSTYGGSVNADGTGARLVSSAVFSTSGASIGSVGTVKDTLDDASQHTYSIQGSTTTGSVSFVAEQAGGVAYSATAAATTLTPVAGASGNNITLTVLNTSGVTDTTYTGTHNVTISGFTAAPNSSYGSYNSVTLTGSPQTNSVTFTAGVATFPLVLDNAAAQNILFSISGLTYPDANTLTITPTAGAVSKLVFTNSPVTATAGVASGTITVQRQDQYSNPVTAAADRTVTLSSGSTGTVTFSGGTSVTISNGSSSVSFTYTDTKAGTPTITAASTSPTTVTSATQQETINPAAPSKLAFTTQLGNGTGGSAFSTQPAVTLQDQYGNTVTGTAQNVTVAIQNNAGGGTLSGTATVAVNTSTGVATFSGLSINKGGNGYTLTATGSTVSMTAGVVVSNGFNVLSADPVTIGRAWGTYLRIPVTEVTAKIAGGTTPYTVQSVTSPSEDSVSLSGGYILFAPAANVNTTRTLNYTVADATTPTALTASSTITVTVTNAVGAQHPVISTSGNTVTATFFGMPGFVYKVQKTTSISPADWQDFATSQTADSSTGKLVVTDTLSNGASAYYRLVQ